GIFSQVFSMRVGHGDIYPFYSTYRTDPLGCSGIKEVYGRMDGVSSEINVRELLSIEGLDSETTLFLFGLPRRQFRYLRGEDDHPVVEAVNSGARLVITMNPERVSKNYKKRADVGDDFFSRREKLKKERESGSESEEDESDQDSEEGVLEFDLSDLEALPGEPLMEKWGIKVLPLEDYKKPENGWRVRSKTLKMPRWMSPYRFEVDEEWAVIARVEGKPVVVERSLGKGKVVFVSDTYFASNESLASGGNSEWLLWLMGNSSKVVIDETIHGSQRQTGTVQMIKRFRLHGIFIGIGIFIALFAWRSANSLAPSNEMLERGLVGRGGAVMGEDSRSGMVQLLRRSIPAADLLDRCLSTWKSTQNRSVTKAQIESVNSAAIRHKSDPKGFNVVSAYREITELLKRR
ncbi:MAG: DUF4350 domain-containing protein, partial [Verrucomicrobiota bacterium]